VLLADGRAVSISQLKPGEKVMATNVKTGKVQPETVQAVLVHHDSNLYDLRVSAGGRTLCGAGAAPLDRLPHRQEREETCATGSRRDACGAGPPCGAAVS
jgi:hypothetical protein